MNNSKFEQNLIIITTSHYLKGNPQNADQLTKTSVKLKETNQSNEKT